MNAAIRPRDLMELLQQHGCTLLDGKPAGGLKKAGNGSERCGLDDDPSRHDEDGALRFMDLCPNNAKRNPRRDDAVREIAWIKTALGPNRTVSIAWLMERLTEVAGVPLNPAEVRTSDKLRAIELIAIVRGYFAPEKRETIQRFAELSLDDLKALDERLAASEQHPEILALDNREILERSGF
jgi:hypothetical protein